MALRYSWVSIAVAVLLVALFIREWRLSRIHADALLARIEAATADREREGRIAIRELRASIGSLRAELRQVRLPEPAARGSVEPSAAPGQPPDMLAHMGASGHLESADAPQLSSPLPELPPGVHADKLVRTLDVDGILSDSRLTPDGRVLPRAARFRATEILVRAKTEAERLETEIASALAEELDELRTAGDFE